MTQQKFDSGLYGVASPGSLSNSSQSGFELEQAMRTLDVHEASFALEYLRKACLGAIPNSLRQRIGESDLIQDALLQATESISQFRGKTLDSFRSWLREIYQNRLKNLVRAHLTSERRSVRREESSSVDSVVAEGTGSNQLMLDETTKLEMQIMQRTFQLLSAKDQQVVELHSRRGLGFEQIAGMLGLSESTVRKRYTRAIGRWRKLVQRATQDSL